MSFADCFEVILPSRPRSNAGVHELGLLNIWCRCALRAWVLLYVDKACIQVAARAYAGRK